jgi:type II secretory pathway pseudopilin PulG
MTRHISLVANRAGHTLVELLTVLVLLMVLVSVATPSMRGQIAQNKTRRALDRVAADIAYARMAAVRNGASTVLQFSGTSYTIEVQSSPARTVRSVELTRDFPGVSLTPPTSDGRLVFDSRGLLISSTPGPMIAAQGSASDTAVITAAGRIYRAY